MSNAHYVLFNNRSCIQFSRYIVTGCTDNLHTSLECRMIRLRSYKRRKERVMYINNLIRISINHLLGNYLHIARQYNKCNIMLGKQFHLLTLLFFFRLLCDRKQIERNSEPLCYMLQIRMVTYNKRYFYIPFSGCISCQYIEKTV